MCYLYSAVLREEHVQYKRLEQTVYFPEFGMTEQAIPVTKQKWGAILNSEKLVVWSTILRILYSDKRLA